MSSPHTDELGQRLRALVDHHVSDEARARHLAAVEVELRQRPGTATHEATGSRAARWRGRRWLAGLAAATTVLTPGVAAAAQGAVPGDALYSVKRATEHVHVLIAPDVVARHRVTELAALLDRDTAPATLARATTAARDAVAALPAGHPLNRELATLLARIADDRPPSDTAPPPPAGTDTTATDPEPEPDEDETRTGEDETGAGDDLDDGPDTDGVEDGEEDAAEDEEEGPDDPDDASDLEDDHGADEPDDADDTQEPGDTATAAADADTQDDERDD